MLTISQLFIYPVKSLAGIPIHQAPLTDRGFKHDRRWMLIDLDNCFFTQREIPGMALLEPAIFDDKITITQKNTGEQFSFPLNAGSSETCIARIWDDQCEVRLVNKEADDWFSDMLHTKCRLAFMPD